MIYCICGKKENMSVLKATTPYNTTQRIAKDRLYTLHDVRPVFCI